MAFANPWLKFFIYLLFNIFFSSCLFDKKPISIKTEGISYDFKTAKPANLCPLFIANLVSFKLEIIFWRE